MNITQGLKIAAVIVAALIFEGIAQLIDGAARFQLIGLGVVIGCMEGNLTNLQLRLAGATDEQLAPFRKWLGIATVAVLAVLIGYIWKQWHLPPQAERLMVLKLLAGMLLGLWIAFRILRPPPRKRRRRLTEVLSELQRRLAEFVQDGQSYPAR